MFKKVSVVGLGYIGLPTAAILASRGIQVVGLDVNQQVVDTLNAGGITIVEPELDGLVHSAVTCGRLRASMTPEPADAFIVAVPTPFKGDHEPDLSYIESATRSIAPVLRPGNLVILESTSPVGTTEKMAEWLAIERPDLKFPQSAGEDADIHLAHCPERVLPGQIIRELVENDRIIGGMTRKAAEMAITLYSVFVQGECLRTDAKTAELCKLVENSYRDVNIALANELSLICEKHDIDVWSLISLANRHPRVNILQPGPGVGGHCIAVDPWFIVHSAPETARLIKTAREVNDHKPHHVIAKILGAAEATRARKIACFGLSFKADIDDLRESPALEIVVDLASRGIADILAVEPHINELPPSIRGQSKLTLVDAQTALAEADLLVLLVNHRAFAAIDPKALSGRPVIDTRGAWSRAVAS